MIAINYHSRLNLARVKTIFYAADIQENHPGCDVVYYYSCQKPASNAKEFKTLLIDLSPDPDELLNSFRKSTKKEIRHAMADDQIDFVINEEPDQEVVKAFISAHDAFADLKKVPHCSWNLLYNLQAAEKLVIASASKSGETLCQFALINDPDRWVCLCGYNIRFSHLEDDIKARLISRANRALEYQCMLRAKTSGKKVYDLYGLTLDPDNPSASNVDQYKMGFRGAIVTEYNIAQPITFRGKMYFILKRLLFA